MIRNKIMPALAASLFLNVSAAGPDQEIHTESSDKESAVVAYSDYREVDELQTYFRLRVEEALKGGRLTKDDMISFSVRDISSGADVISINQNEQIMAASTIKLFIMAAYFNLVESGIIPYTSTHRNNLRKMIVNSDNRATNAMLRAINHGLGMPAGTVPPAAQNVLIENYPEFDKTEIVEFIPDWGVNNGRTYRNMTSPQNLVDFYSMLWYRKMPFSEEMLKYLKSTKTQRLFTGGCNTSIVFNKTGTLYGQVSDSALVVISGPDDSEYPYVIAGAIEDRTKTDTANRTKSYGRWVRERAAVLHDFSKKVYEMLYREHVGKDYTCKPVVRKKR